MKITKDTSIYMSFSLNPGNLGARVYNFFFEKLAIDAIYVPRKSFCPKVVTETIRNLELSGASISMPIKQSILPYLDELSLEASDIKSVNTIINSSGRLIGHNTDAWGFYKIIENLSFKTVCIYGAGGVVPSLLWALIKKGISYEDICIVSRRMEQALDLKKDFAIKTPAFLNFDLLINATPSGNSIDDDIVKLCSKAKMLIDLNPAGIPNQLAQKASEMCIPALSGREMFIYQFQKQFKIYRGIYLDLSEIRSVLE